MGARHRLALESLEPRQLLSGAPWMAHFLSRPATVVSSQPLSPTEAALSPDAVAHSMVGDPNTALTYMMTPSSRDFLASTNSGTALSGRWDWLAGTTWYVPTENLLAYSTSPDLSDPQPIADQTLWYFTVSDYGQIQGQSVTKLSSSPIPTTRDFVGVVTESGQIRIEFLSDVPGEVPITGLGQMRWLQGQWRAEMQMGTGSSTIVTHWAYMTQITGDVAPPEPTAPPIDPSLMADEWRWLEGTHWAINDSALLGSSTGGVFQIDSFRNGYFWGSGTSSQPFNLLGSVTPEGNLFLMVSVDGATPTSQTGQLRQTSSGGTMVLRTYEGQPTAGTAWQIDAAQSPSVSSPVSTSASARGFLSSRQER